MAWGANRLRSIGIYYLSTNRNKEGIAVNFRNPEGLALLRRLAIRSDEESDQLDIANGIGKPVHDVLSTHNITGHVGDSTYS